MAESHDTGDIALNVFLRWAVFVAYAGLGATGVMPVHPLVLIATSAWIGVTGALCSWYWLQRRPTAWYDSSYLYLDYVSVVLATLSLADLRYPVWMAFVLLMIQAPSERPTGSAALFNSLCAGGYALCAAILHAAGWYHVKIGVAVVTTTVMAFIAVNLAITFDASRRLQRTIEDMAVTDSLTGLANRRQLSHFLANPPDEVTLAVIVMDVDRFKVYNDEFGHLAGDQMLVRLAELTRHAFPDAAMISRYGGDEFVVLQPCRTMEEAEARVRYLLNGRSRARLPVSVGVALWPDDHPTLDAAFAAADDCLRAAKKSKRGSFACWSSDGHIMLRAS